MFRFEAWPTAYRHITQPFGANPASYAKFGLAGHEGADVRAHAGTPIYAVAPGAVRVIARDLGHPYGLHVRIDHADGYQTVYAHLSAIDPAIQPGATVRAGQEIGQAGSTGNSTAAHLHLTLKRAGAQVDGYPAGIIDPGPYLDALLAEERAR